MPSLRKVDISDLYERLKSLKGSYVLCIDIKGFAKINETYGYAAGDLVLSETAKRISECILDNMMLFRIGKDEFAVITECFEASDAEAIAKAIVSKNNTAVRIADKDIVINLRVGITSIPGEGTGISYYEVFDNMQSAIEKVKQTELDYLTVK